MLSFPQRRWQLARALARPRGPQESAHLILDRLYLGDWSAAGDRDKLTELGITHVVSVFELPPDIPDVIRRDNLLHIQINDTVNADILRHLERTTDFIKSALETDKSNKVLVHCLMGISRSATVVAAYLIATRKMASSDAIAFVQGKRAIVCPNIGFRQQLEVFAAKYVGRQSPLSQIKAWKTAAKRTRGSVPLLP